MAICRFSDYQCDLYIYEAAEGIMCHVASRRRVNEPEQPKFTFDEEWFGNHLKHLERVAACELVPIGLSYDGESKAFADYGELLEFVRMLRDEGYQVPDWVTADIAVEAALEEGS